ncbi:regulator of chromosome condensation 1/beta-lactamase-inhibitor protein II [Jimgerdemannia flammicorona]|uniref:Regulator of chromosome condensation 1/beta-lactamase-inhibitor protein II n=2 Tax=Jimgerdemannia flammicorona TaxID=994334 RepID=A0A433QLZ5_9FUNG|nr:regulator of chromosome condensation 1/beta-lactamase-inhibitor protein II [Jimgerdemannia flammicorona]RUS30804.1 regulator of chromosome condensation 1/beta-lactamase-inhibitor protein II [Jimgerdemannia flammicorona]
MAPPRSSVKKEKSAKDIEMADAFPTVATSSTEPTVKRTASTASLGINAVADTDVHAISKRGRATKKAMNKLPSLPQETGKVFVFGNGDTGQLGLGEDMLDRKKPYPIKDLEDEGIVDVLAGGLHTVAITREGKLWSWGCNDKCALGRSGEENVPEVVGNLDTVRIVKVACGDSITVALSDDGKVYSWGTYRSSEGDLGFNPQTSIQAVPTLLQALTKETVVDIVAGVDHALALTSTGDVYGWGNGQQNQLGRRIIERRKINGLNPERLGLKHIKLIGSGSYHSFAVDVKDTIFVWGLNNFRQSGLSDEEGGLDDIISTPTPISSLQGKGIVRQVAGGEHHSLVLFESGEVYAFGRADSSQLGLPKQLLDQPTPAAAPSSSMDVDGSSVSTQHKRAVSTPTPIPNLPPVVAISVGSNHNLALTRDGDAYAWGFGETHALGNGEDKDEECPIKVTGQKLEGFTVLQVSAGGQHSVLLAK